jgi:hypothetical protein
MAATSVLFVIVFYDENIVCQTRGLRILIAYELRGNLSPARQGSS